MLKANYHTHLVLCGHAEGMSMDYVNEALRLGMKELGISDHAYVPCSIMDAHDYEVLELNEQMDEDVFLNVYIPDVMRAKETPGIKVLLGIEAEYFPGHLDHFKWLRSKLDYMNLGQHFFEVNGHLESPYHPINADGVKAYTDYIVEGMDTGLFNTVVHPDLYIMSYVSADGEKRFDDLCEKSARRIIEAAIRNNMYLEINANGTKYRQVEVNGRLEYRYPRTEFWKIVKEYKDAKIIIGCDAHKIEGLGNQCVSNAINFAKKLGLKVEEYMEINH